MAIELLIRVGKLPHYFLKRNGYGWMRY